MTPRRLSVALKLCDYKYLRVLLLIITSSEAEAMKEKAVDPAWEIAKDILEISQHVTSISFIEWPSLVSLSSPRLITSKTDS